MNWIGIVRNAVGYGRASVSYRLPYGDGKAAPRIVQILRRALAV